MNEIFGVTAADELFAALDGHIIGAADAQWQLRVAGVYQVERTTWVQCILSGPRQHVATFQTHTAKGAEILTSVIDWLTECEASQPALVGTPRVV